MVKLISSRNIKVNETGDKARNHGSTLGSASNSRLYASFTKSMFTKPIPHRDRFSSSDPYQRAILLKSNVVSNKSAFYEGISGKLTFCSTYATINVCPDHPKEQKVIFQTCGMRVCDEPACKEKRYNTSYARLKAVTLFFKHRGGLHSAKKDQPMLLDLTFRHNQPVNKAIKRQEDKCIDDLIRHFKLKSVRIFEQKYKPQTKLSHNHVHMLCDNDYIREKEDHVISNYWKKTTKRVFGIVSEVMWVKRVPLETGLNYLSARLGYPLIETYKKHASKSKNNRILRQYVNHVYNQNFFVVSGFDKKTRRKMKQAQISGRKSNSNLKCRICGKPLVFFASCLVTELTWFKEPEKKLEIVEYVPSVSHINNINIGV